MTMRTLLTAASLTLLPVNVVAQDAYLCVAEGVAGVVFNKEAKRWSAGTFSPKDIKHVFRRAKPGERFGSNVEFKWGLYGFGKNSPSVICRDDFDAEGHIFCRGLTEVQVNRKNLRYQAVYAIGYVFPYDEEESDTPHIEFGTCSPL
jgi:hypothetical protein